MVHNSRIRFCLRAIDLPQKLAFLSLPRDMRVDLPGHGSQKINHANAYAEMEQAGSGPTATAEIIRNVLHQPIQYYLRVDFDGFLNSSIRSVESMFTSNSRLQIRAIQF